MGGGKIEIGESHEDALKREMKEEFGITVEIHEHLLTVNHKYPDFKINLDTYRVEWIDGEIHPHEHGDIDWVAVDGLDDYDLLDADIPIKEHLQKKYHFRRKPRKCPNCGESPIATILIGMPIMSDKLEADIDAGRVVLGGCGIIEGHSPEWKCTNCNTELFKDNFETDQSDFNNAHFKS